MVVALVGVQLVRAPAWSPAAPGPHARHGVQRGHQHHAVVPVGAAQRDAERRAAGVGDKVALRPSAGIPAAAPPEPWPAPPGLPRSVGLGPTSAPPFLPSGWRCRGQPGSSPVVLHRAAAPEAHGAAGPILRRCATRPGAASASCRSSPSRWVPHANGCLCAARTEIPARAARSRTRGRPPFGFGRRGGSRGSISCHRSSGTRSAMPIQRPRQNFVPNPKPEVL